MRDKRKRTTWHISPQVHTLIKNKARQSGKSMSNYIDNICIDIANGRYDEFIDKEQNTKGLAVHQDMLSLARKHLKDSNVSTLNAVVSIIKHDLDKKTAK